MSQPTPGVTHCWNTTVFPSGLTAGAVFESVSFVRHCAGSDGRETLATQIADREVLVVVNCWNATVSPPTRAAVRRAPGSGASSVTVNVGSERFTNTITCVLVFVSRRVNTTILPDMSEMES